MKYIDYGTMQSDAQRRVLEMQRRARNAVYFPHNIEETDNICSESADNCDAADCGTPVNCSCTDHSDDCFPTAPPPCTCTENKSHDILQRIAKDPEEALLLVILVLLISEKADMLLILALVYLLV